MPSSQNRLLWIEFFDDLQNVRGRSQNTIMAYRRDLDLWMDYQDQGQSQSIEGFYDFMKKQKLSVRSQARVISSLRTYFKFLQEHGHKATELRDLKPPKVKAKLPKTITPEEFHQLMKACEIENPHRASRNQLCLLFLYGLGCRVSEMIDLDVSDVNATERWVKVLGKGGKERLIPISDVLFAALENYLTKHRESLLKEKSGTLIVNDKGHRASRVDIWRWLAAWSKKAGFEHTVHPHQFRHGCATALLESGADLRSIQLLLGHSSLQTTQIYTQVSQNKLNQTLEQHHPLSRIKDSEI
ncbi:MAG: tyrosine-type recombinase/integrase [Bdellovibrionales bacterium]